MENNATYLVKDLIRNFHKNRKKYAELFEKKDYSHIKFVRLRTNKEVEKFVRNELHIER